MSGLKRVAVAIVVVALGVTFTPTASGAAVQYKNYEADGWVTTADIAAPSHAGFVVGDEPAGPGTLTTTGGVDPARNPDNSLTIRATNTTKFWKFNSTTGQYQSLPYDQVIKAGEHIHVGGRYGFVDDHWVLFANFVWSPPPPPQGWPGNPAPGIRQDFTFQRTFRVSGSVNETGTTLLFQQGWSKDNGFVMGSITDYGPSDHVQKVAAAHANQVPVHTNNFTNFYLQDPVTNQYRRATKDQLIQNGAPVFAAGHYAWVNLDWLFVANYVWRPAPTIATGLVHFDENAQRQSTGTPTATSGWQGSTYSGASTVSHTSNNDVNPGPVSFTLDWELDPARALWFFSGKWAATKQGTSDGLSGDISGYWDPLSGNVTDATALITQGTGIHCNVSGAGPFTGVGLSDPTATGQNPPLNLDGSFKLSATRDATVTC
jgi:hypothetical protein